ncbi:hypothetical protein [Runella sp.]|uniref:hypothetical protein n=1 Tax=Runella sp. TaxID=1960881 RepID=UPI003D0EB86B
METTIAERFRILIKELGKTNNSFAISIAKNSSTILYIVDGKSKPSYDVFDAIFSKYPDINPTWLMTGEGEMFKKKKDIEKASSSLELIEKIEHFFANKYDQILEQKNSVIADQRFMIEMLKGQLGKPSGVAGEAKVKPMWEQKEEIGLIA